MCKVTHRNTLKYLCEHCFGNKLSMIKYISENTWSFVVLTKKKSELLSTICLPAKIK